MTLREIVFMCMDEVKLNSDDAFYTEDHIVFLISKYRSFILKKELEKENKELSTSNTQTICLDLEEINNDDPCSPTMLKSKQQIPNVINDSKASIYPIGYFGTDNIIYTSMERLRFTSYNKWTSNLVYAAKGPDNYLYLNSSNPQYKYMNKIEMKAVFEDFDKAAQYTCNAEGDSDVKCDILDSDFPLEEALVPTVIELVVKELLGAAYRPKDDINNDSDDLSDIIAWARRNMKSSLQKQIEG